MSDSEYDFQDFLTELAMAKEHAIAALRELEKCEGVEESVYLQLREAVNILSITEVECDG